MSDTEVIVEQITQSDKDLATQAKAEVDRLLDEISASEKKMHQNITKLGSLLLDIREKKYWIALGYESWGNFIKSLPLGRTQVFQTISIAETLTPLIGAESLEEIGISKAIELRRVVNATGCRPSEELLAKAKDPNVSVEKFRELAHKAITGDPPPTGSYMHLGGFWVTTDERKEINEAIEIAKRVDPLIPNNISESEQLKEVILRFGREFAGTYQSEAE